MARTGQALDDSALAGRVASAMLSLDPQVQKRIAELRELQADVSRKQAIIGTAEKAESMLRVAESKLEAAKEQADKLVARTKEETDARMLAVANAEAAIKAKELALTAGQERLQMDMGAHARLKEQELQDFARQRAALDAEAKRLIALSESLNAKSDDLSAKVERIRAAIAGV